MPRFDISYSPVEDTVISLKGQPGGGGWNVRDPGTGQDIDFDYSNIRVGLGVESKLTGKIWGYFEGGYQFNQSVELDGRNETDLDESWYLSGGIRLRF